MLRPRPLFIAILATGLGSHAARAVGLSKRLLRCPKPPCHFDVGAHGVVGDGVHDDTFAMQQLLDSIPDESTVVIPADMIVLSGPLTVTSDHFTLCVNGTLRAIEVDALILQHVWPQIRPLVNYGFSDDLNRPLQYQALVYAANVTHFRLTGTGVVDGRGAPWWDAFRNHPATLLAGRPNLVQIVNSSYVEIDSVELRDAGFWTIHPVLCDHVHVHNTTIRAPLYAPNVDGIDPDSCQHVLVEYNDVGCGDDHIAIKAGLCAGKGVLDCTDAIWSSGAYATRNVTVRHNVFRTGMGIAVGSESSGSITDVAIYNNSIGVCESGSATPLSCGWGPALHLKTTITRGGSVERISFSHNKVYNTSMFILVEMSYQSHQNEPPPVDYAATMVRDVLFDANEVLGLADGATFECSYYDACREITVTNNIFHNTAAGSDPWTCKYITDYTVYDNFPGGLEECMAQSMNDTALAFSSRLISSA
jgi:polygalacturonase